MPELPQPLPPHLPGDEPPANDASLRGLTMALDARRAAALLEECCRCMEGMPKRGAAMQWGVQWLARQGLSTSAKSLERKFYAWLGGGKSQLALVDRRKVLGKNTGKGIHAPAFQLYWVGLVAQYQRSVKSAYRELCRAWFAGQVIPGYETAWDRRALPEGWSYRNLCNALPTAAELDIYRKGMDQAHALMPSVRTTRAGSYPTEFVFFDDVWVDRLSRFGREINRCMQLGALDFFTGMRLTAGTKFRHRRADGTHVYFIQDDMLMQVAAYLHDIGYNARRGTTLVVENGTAAITPEMEAMLQALTAGKVRVERSGMIGMRQLIRGYAGRAKGNPRDKAPLESWHSLFHNRLCHGPGWAGKDRTPPETVHGIIEAEKQHIKNLLDLPIDRAALSQGHLPTFAELCEEIARVTGEINLRCDHELEGWRAAGFERLEYTLDPASGAWGDVDDLAADPQKLAFVQSLPPAHKRLRNLSPAEAWNRSLSLPGNELTRFSDEQCAMLMSLAKEGGMWRHRVRAHKGFFVWKDKTGWLDYDELHFETTYADAMGYERPAPFRDELQGVLNPFAPGSLYLFDARGVLLGTCKLVHKVPRGDVEALHSAMGRAAHRQALQLEYMQEALSPYEQETLAKKEWNRRVADCNPATGEAAPLTIEAEETARADAAALRRASRRAPAAALASPSDNQPQGLGLQDSYGPSSFNS